MTTLTTYQEPVKHRGLIVAFAALCVALAVALFLILTPTRAVPVHAVHAGTAPHVVRILPTPITIAAVGDSITAWSGYDPVKNSWAADLKTGPVVVDHSAGWAVSAMRLQNMAENIQPTHTDYIVIMGGVNDRAWPITPYSAMTASLEQIVAKSGEPADRVVISAIAPARQFLPFVNAWNAQEEALAAQHGWHFINPWGPLTGADGNYIPSLTLDGTHPTDAGEQIIANEIAADVQAFDAAR
jgi:lysophospholipase L1-like esterase